MSTALATRPPTSVVVRDPSDLADQINGHHEACCRAAGESFTHAMAAGELLVTAKAACKHGEWGQWLADNFQGSDRTARVYMRLAKHRQAFDYKTAESADLQRTIASALEHIAPKQEKEREADPAAIEAHERKIEEGLAKLVLEFDDIVDAAEAFGKTHEEAFRLSYPDAGNGVDEVPTFEEHREDVENWRSAEWFPAAVERVRKRRDQPTVATPPPEPPSRKRHKRTLAQGRPSAMLIRAALAYHEQLVEIVQRVGIAKDVAAELERIRQRIKEAAK